MSNQVSEKKQKYTFPKIEKLCSEKLIQILFKKGQILYQYPFKIYYSSAASLDFQVPQILFSVPKKNFRKAVERNNIKRKLREAYRLNKAGIFIKDKNNFIVSQIAVVYIAKENISFLPLQEKLISILYRLMNSRKL